MVYLGYDSSLNRAVAVKVITPQLLEDKEVRARFVREAQVIAGFRHPNIISVYELNEDTDTGLPFIAMEYVEGADLKTLISDRSFVPFEKKLEWIIQVCNGLQYSHEHGILHRDVKPNNILVGREGTVRIVDFGLARIRSSDMTQTGLTMGTPHYMSPEQATGAGDLDGRADVYSTGVVLYELISLHLPFQGETPWQIITQILSKPHASLSAVLPGCAEDLVRIVDRALAKDRNDRFAHCGELAEALRQFSISLPARLADVQLAVARLRARFQQPSSEEAPRTLARVYDDFLFDLDVPEPNIPRPVIIDFGPADLHSDYGCLLLSLAGLKDRLEGVLTKLRQTRQLLVAFQEAQDMFETGKLQECLVALDAILQTHPGAISALALKTECLQLLEERRQPELRRRHFQAALVQARQALAEGNTEPAKRAVARALQTEPVAPEALELESQLLSVAEREQRIENLLEAAQKAFEDQQFKACLQSAQEGLAFAPEHAAFHRLSSSAQHELEIRASLDAAHAALVAKRWRRSRRALSGALRLDPTRPEVLSLKHQLSQRQRVQSRMVLLSVLALTAAVAIWLWLPLQSTVSRREASTLNIDSTALAPVEQEVDRVVQAKRQASEARAADLSPATYQQALQLEREGTELRDQKNYVAAVEKLSTAREAFVRSESEAKEAARQRQLVSQQKQQAQNAMQAFAAARKGADGFGAATLDSYQEALNHASKAQTLWDQSDFVAAQASFERARQAMANAQSQAEARQLKQDQEAILALVDRFEAAFNGKDLAAVKLLWPSLSLSEEQKMRAEFASRSISLRMQKEGPPVVRSDRATLTCQLSKQIENADGVIQRSAGQPVFNLRKTPSGWIISEIFE